MNGVGLQANSLAFQAAFLADFIAPGIPGQLSREVKHKVVKKPWQAQLTPGRDAL